MPGRGVLLHGTSSSGKTTVARAVQRLSEEPWVHLGIDAFWNAIDERWMEHGPRASEGFLWSEDATIVPGPARFDRYVATLGRSSPPEGPYFGWLSNSVPGYPETLNLKTHVRFRENMLRPTIELEPTEHPLAVHQRGGISPEALQAIVEAGLHRGN